MGGGPNSWAVSDHLKAGYCVYAVGDCVQPRRIKEAIEEGFLAALQI